MRKEMRSLLSESIRQPLITLFGLCVISAAMSALTNDRRAGLSVNGLCALGAAICVLRALHEMMM